MQERALQFTFRARYFKLGEITPTTQEVWFVLHGYGQLARYFINKFTTLKEKNICVIAPEGLSRFYLENVEVRNAGGSNRVGATWMTRENRDMDIDNYLAYLQSVYETELKGIATLPKTTILGFSQGAATATRWVLANPVPFDRFVIWAGMFPNDMDFEAGRKIFQPRQVVTVYGNQDPYLTGSRKQEMQELTEKLGLRPQQVTFEGKHEINEDALIQVSSL